MGLLNDIGNTLDSANKLLNNPGPRDFDQEGFTVPSIPSGSGGGLPSSKVVSQRQHITRRHIVHWFVPEVGVVNMYVNPSGIDYSFKKQITQERTKGGYVMQYWGEELPIITLTGSTGSSGIEGINVLYEIYRAEQLNFDPIGLTIASDSTLSGIKDIVSDVGSALGGVGGGLISAATNGVMGLNPLTQSILPRNPPTLSAMALGIEMYYSGKVYRGFFTEMSYRESADSLGLITYTIRFTVTQSRGYRVNTLPWQRSAISGPSDNSEGAIPLSYGTGASFGR